MNYYVLFPFPSWRAPAYVRSSQQVIPIDPPRTFLCSPFAQFQPSLLCRLLAWLPPRFMFLRFFLSAPWLVFSTTTAIPTQDVLRFFFLAIRTAAHWMPSCVFHFHPFHSAVNLLYVRHRRNARSVRGCKFDGTMVRYCYEFRYLSKNFFLDGR